MITATYALSGLLMALTGWLFAIIVPDAVQQTVAGTVIFLIASAAAASSAFILGFSRVWRDTIEREQCNQTIKRTVESGERRGWSQSSHRDPCLHSHRVVIRMQAGFVLVEQSGIDQRLDILMRAPLIAAEGNCERADAGGLAVHMAQQFEAARRHDPGKQLEALEADMPFGVFLRRFAAFGPVPRIDDTLRHGIEAVTDMNLQLFAHQSPPFTRSISTPKSAISRSIETKTWGASLSP